MAISPREIERMLEAARYLPEGHPAVLATVVHVEGSSYRRRGARLMVTESGRMAGGISGGCLEGDALRKARQVMYDGRARLFRWDTRTPDGKVIGASLGCRGLIDVLMVPLRGGALQATLRPLQAWLDSRRPLWIAHPWEADRAASTTPLWWVEGEKLRAEFAERPEVQTLRALAAEHSHSFDCSVGGAKWFVEHLPPIPRLVIIGGGYDVPPLLELASVLGWRTTVVANLQGPTAKQLVQADELIHLRQEDVWSAVRLDAWSALILMSHDYALDLEALRALAPAPVPYIGVLGPHKRHERMAAELPAEWLKAGGLLAGRRFAPVGLDIGAQTPEEIALAIIAQVKAVFADRQGGHLFRRRGPIYDR